MTDRADGGGALALDAVLCDLDDALDRLSALALWQLPDASLKDAGREPGPGPPPQRGPDRPRVG